MFKILSLFFISCFVSNNLAVSPFVCFADFRWDDCGKPPKAVMYYYKPGSRCEIGMWKGCLPNPNMFADEYECINTCVFVQRSVMQIGTEEPENKAEYQTEKPESDQDRKYEYKPEADTWLHLHIVPQTWKYAIRQCQLEGGILASPSSQALTKAMLAMMMDNNVALSRGVFIGIHPIISEGDYISLDGYTYSSRTQSCYKFFSKPETWHEADRVCTAEGNHLAIINSDIEAEVLIDIFAKNPLETFTSSFSSNFHIGYRLWDDGWRTIYGQNITEAGYDKWAKGQPNNANQTQYTGAINLDRELNDLTETDLQPFFCESSPEYNPHYLPQILTTLLHKNTKK